MEEHFKYLTPGEDDKNWGLFLTVSGSGAVDPNQLYPNCEHPTGYYFTWEKGRVLNEFQIIYITDGTGVLEISNNKYNLHAGSIIIVKPDIWHRYKPQINIGWKEKYIGFIGKFAFQLFQHPFFETNPGVIDIGIHEEILDIFLKIEDLANLEKPGYQKIASGLIVQLLGYMISFESQKEFTDKKIESVIEEARFLMRKSVHEEIDVKKMATELNIGYSYFRKMFKKYTGVSPHHYHLELKVMRAKELLLSTNLSIKEICYDLQFNSIHYFSRMFKERTGVSPSKFR